MEEKDEMMVSDLHVAHEVEEALAESEIHGVQEVGEVLAESEVQAGVEDDKDVIYDISDETEESQDSAELQVPAQSPDPVQLQDDVQSKDPAYVEVKKKVKAMGAETLLSIIRDNRNAAIQQIIREVEASQDSALPSGVSVVKGCNSIFDLAALA